MGTRIRYITPISGEWWYGAKYTLGIIILNLAIWLVLVIGSKIVPGLEAKVSTTFGISPSITFQNLYVWTFLTYAFVHFGFWHVFNNMLWIFFFGPQIERDFGPRQFLIFYLVCTFGAALLSIFYKEIANIPAPTIGASGAVMGILVAYGMSYPNQSVYLFGVFPLKVKYLVMGIVFIQFALVLQEGNSSGTDYTAHIGGLLTGFLYMKMPSTSFRRVRSRRPLSINQKKHWRGEGPRDNDDDDDRTYYLEP